jgi:hypothetical protein
MAIRWNNGASIPPIRVATAQKCGKTAPREMNKLTTLLSRLALGFTVATLGFINTFAADSGVALEKSEMQVRVTWPISAEESGMAVFSLDRTKPLIESFAIAAKGQPLTVVMKALDPVTLLTVGSRDSNCGFGIRQSDTGDKRFVPWFNAPPGTEQRLGVFYLLTRGDARRALDAAARYTHGDRYKKLPGHLTFTSHYHVEYSKNVLDDQKEQQTNGVPRGLETPAS